MRQPVIRRAVTALAAAGLSLALVERAPAQSAFLVKDMNGVSASTNPWYPTSVNGAFLEPPTLFFTADVSGTGRELYKSDGTEPGTALVEDIRGGPASSDPQHLTRVSGGFGGPGRLFFAADDGVHGVELWKSDGTAAGTQLVRDIRPGVSSSSPEDLAAVPGVMFAAGRLFFAADDGVSGVELWVSDGTAAGTVRVKDINPGPSSSAPIELTAMGTGVFFQADDGVAGRELWKSDGTEAGTVRVEDINPGIASSHPLVLTNAGGTLFFQAITAAEGAELWKSDGTAAGTTLVKDIQPAAGYSNPAQFAVVGATLFFTADDGTIGRELWKSDGTPAGTVLVKDVNPVGSAFDGGGSLVEVGGALFFAADDGVAGLELWKSDGTGPGTVLVRDILPGPSGSEVAEITNVRGIAFFRARNGEYDRELWRSDGRAAGTYLVQDINLGPYASDPYYLAVSGQLLFFGAFASAEGGELWATDLVSKDGFETGGTGAWSSANTDGGDLAAQAAAALHGTAGLAAHVDDTASLFVTDESPHDERRYRARFRLDPNAFDPGEANGNFRVRVFIAFEEDPNLRLITLVLRRIGGQYALMGRVRLDDGSRAQTPFSGITDQQHMVEIEWTQSAAPDANDGTFALWIDEIPVSLLTGLDMNASTVDFARLGAMTVKPGANGTLYLDDFESRRERYIGYLP